MKRKFAIFDLDGCLFDDRDRRRVLMDSSLNGQARWDAYHAGIGQDSTNPQALELLAHWVAKGAKIAFITGRPEKYAAETERKIKQVFEHLAHKFDLHHEGSWLLCMRGDEDKSKSPAMKARVLADHGMTAANVAVAYDDREDVLNMYKKRGINAWLLNHNPLEHHAWQLLDQEPVANKSAANSNIARAESLEPVADLMDKHAATFRERYESYGNNAEVVGRMMAAMFPNGVQLKTAKDFEIWHLFELMIVKLSRFSSSGLRHEDSINDLPAYCGMVHRLINDHDITFL